MVECIRTECHLLKCLAHCVLAQKNFFPRLSPSHQNDWGARCDAVLLEAENGECKSPDPEAGGRKQPQHMTALKDSSRLSRLADDESAKDSLCPFLAASRKKWPLEASNRKTMNLASAQAISSASFASVECAASTSAAHSLTKTCQGNSQQLSFKNHSSSASCEIEEIVKLLQCCQHGRNIAEIDDITVQAQTLLATVSVNTAETACFWPHFWFFGLVLAFARKMLQQKQFQFQLFESLSATVSANCSKLLWHHQCCRGDQSLPTRMQQDQTTNSMRILQKKRL